MDSRSTDIDWPHIHDFQEAVWSHYATASRDHLPWRQPGADGAFDPYHILVSELMLQQTQVSRVIVKYQEFLDHFPDIEALAAASLGDVLRIWQGLGYNRRAKFLWQAAQAVVGRGNFPTTLDDLVKLPGVGKNTAGAVLAYAYNQPAVFIETNIRTVYIHHFFPSEDAVDDKELIRIVAETLDTERPREWYWALMDYGSHLKATVGNLSRSSKHFVKQSKFHGSKRQVRGQVLRTLAGGSKTMEELANKISDERLSMVLKELCAEQLILEKDNRYSLD